MEQAVEELMISRLGLVMVEIQLRERKLECFASPRIARAIEFPLGDDIRQNTKIGKMLLLLSDGYSGIWDYSRYEIIVINRDKLSTQWLYI
jgi:hypothetical protein